MALFNLSSLDKVPHMDPVPAYAQERYFPARKVRRTFSPLAKGERQSYVRCLLKQGNVSTAQTDNQQSTVDPPEMWPFTAPEHPFWWLLTQNLQTGFYLSKNNSAHTQHFGGSSNSSPRSESIFLSMSSTCTVFRATHR